MDDGLNRLRVMPEASQQAQFLWATWTLHSIWFDVFASIGEAVNQTVPPLLKRVFAAKEK